MLGLNMLLVSWVAGILGFAIFWIISYFPIKINYQFILSYFLAVFTVGGIGTICAIVEGIIALLKWIF